MPDAMVKRNVSIPKDLDRRFREAVVKRLGFQKGNLSKAVEEALDLWIRHEKGKAPR